MPAKSPDIAEDHRLLAFWAADCAQRVLAIFEAECPGDDRPRKAIEAARAWARGEIRCGSSARIGGWGARAAAVAAHDAARATDHPAAKAAARAAGHAAGVAHMVGHARGAAIYALKAAVSPDAEKDWQWRHLPDHLWPVLEKQERLTRRRGKRSQ